MRHIFYSIFACYFLISCSGNNHTACTAEYRSGITVWLYDKTSGEQLSTCDVTYTIMDGSYIEENKSVDESSCEWFKAIAGAGERAGTYDIEISKPGYNVWERKSVIVGNDGCHVDPISIDAFLIPN